jgi:peroxiredoxin
LGRHYDEFREAGADVVAIFQYRGDPTFHFCRKRKVPFDCLGDPEREGYHAVGLERGSAKEVIGPQLIGGWLRAARHGALPGIPKGDTAQRPGTFVVSPEGKVLYAHYHKDSSDNPDTDELLRVVRGLRASTSA